MWWRSRTITSAILPTRLPDRYWPTRGSNIGSSTSEPFLSPLRPISPRVHPPSARDLKAAVTVVKLTPNSDASRRRVGRRSPAFNCPDRIAWHSAPAICSYRGGAPSCLRLAILGSMDIVLILLSHLLRIAATKIRAKRLTERLDDNTLERNCSLCLRTICAPR
jgi:hypothetical protein